MPLHRSRSFTPNGTPGEWSGIVTPRHGLVDRRCRVSCEIGIEVHERVQPLVAGLDPGEVLVQHLHGLALAAAHRFGQLDDSGFVGIAHGGEP